MCHKAAEGHDQHVHLSVSRVRLSLNPEVSLESRASPRDDRREGSPHLWHPHSLDQQHVTLSAAVYAMRQRDI